MITTLSVVAPVFALILAGWSGRRMGILGPHATKELSRFVVYLALPAVLFDVVAHMQWADFWQPGFIAAFGLGNALTFALATAFRLQRARTSADAVLDGLNASYGNTGFLGFPLAMIVLGPTAVAPTLIALIMTVCVLFGVAIILIEASLQTETRRSRLVLKVGRSLLSNPLLVAPILGAFVPLLGLNLPAVAETSLSLLSAAASPCALVALGLFLGEERSAPRPEHGLTAVLVGFKLIFQPVLTWILAAVVFGLPSPLTQTAVLLAALPTGTGPFMLTEIYQRDASVTSSVVLVSTIASVLTISGYLLLSK